MNGGCKREDSEDIRKAIYYNPESCSDIEFYIAVCLSMWTLDSSLQYHLAKYISDIFYALAIYHLVYQLYNLRKNMHW